MILMACELMKLMALMMSKSIRTPVAGDRELCGLPDGKRKKSWIGWALGAHFVPQVQLSRLDWINLKALVPRELSVCILRLSLGGSRVRVRPPGALRLGALCDAAAETLADEWGARAFDTGDMHTFYDEGLHSIVDALHENIRASNL